MTEARYDIREDRETMYRLVKCAFLHFLFRFFHASCKFDFLLHLLRYNSITTAAFSDSVKYPLSIPVLLIPFRNQPFFGFVIFFKRYDEIIAFKVLLYLVDYERQLGCQP